MNLKKILALVLVLAMLVSMVPTYAFAEDVELWDEEEVAVQDDAALEDVYLDEEPEEVIVEDEPEATEPEAVEVEEPAAEPVAETPVIEGLAAEETSEFDALVAVNETKGTTHESLQDAIDNASDGDVINMYAPTTAGATVNKNVTIKGSESTQISGILTVTSDATLNLHSNAPSVSVLVTSGKLSITGGSYNTVSANGVTSGNVTGGTFKSIDTVLLADGYLFTGYVSGQEIATSLSGVSIAKAADDLILKQSTADGKVIYYNASSLSAALTKSGTIKLLSNVTTGLTSPITVGSDAEITLDLNGKTVTSSASPAIEVLGKLTVTDSTATAAPVANLETGVVTYTAGKINATNGNAINVNGGTLTVESGEIASVTGQGVSIRDSAAGTAVIKGGYVHGVWGVCAFKDATLTISDGVIVGDRDIAVSGNGANNNGTSITITGGTIIGKDSNTTAHEVTCAIYHPQQGTLNISGGNIVSLAGPAVVVRAGNVNITGGVITAKGNVEGKVGDAAGIALPASGIVLDLKAGYPGATTSDKIRVSGTAEVNSAKKDAIAIVEGNGHTYVAESIAVSGGTFSSAVPEKCCADGFVPVKNDDGNYGVVEGEYVARVYTSSSDTVGTGYTADGINDAVTAAAAKFTKNDLTTSGSLEILSGTQNFTVALGTKLLVKTHEDAKFVPAVAAGSLGQIVVKAVNAGTEATTETRIADITGGKTYTVENKAYVAQVAGAEPEYYIDWPTAVIKAKESKNYVLTSLTSGTTRPLTLTADEVINVNEETNKVNVTVRSGVQSGYQIVKIEGDAYNTYKCVKPTASYETGTGASKKTIFTETFNEAAIAAAKNADEDGNYSVILYKQPVIDETTKDIYSMAAKGKLTVVATDTTLRDKLLVTDASAPLGGTPFYKTMVTNSGAFAITATNDGSKNFIYEAKDAVAMVALNNAPAKYFDNVDDAIYFVAKEHSNENMFVVPLVDGEEFTVTTAEKLDTYKNIPIRIDNGGDKKIKLAEGTIGGTPYGYAEVKGEKYSTYTLGQAVASIPTNEDLNPYFEPYNDAKYFPTFKEAANAANGAVITLYAAPTTAYKESFELGLLGGPTTLKVKLGNFKWLTVVAAEGQALKTEADTTDSTITIYSLDTPVASITTGTGTSAKTQLYPSFKLAADAAAGKDVIVNLLATDTTEYTLANDKELKVEKNGFEVKVVAAAAASGKPAYAISEKTEDGVTIYKAVAAKASIDYGSSVKPDVKYYATFAEAAKLAFVTGETAPTLTVTLLGALDSNDKFEITEKGSLKVMPESYSLTTSNFKTTGNLAVNIPSTATQGVKTITVIEAAATVDFGTAAKPDVHYYASFKDAADAARADTAKAAKTVVMLVKPAEDYSLAYGKVVKVQNDFDVTIKAANTGNQYAVIDKSVDGNVTTYTSKPAVAIIKDEDGELVGAYLTIADASAAAAGEATVILQPTKDADGKAVKYSYELGKTNPNEKLIVDKNGQTLDVVSGMDGMAVKTTSEKVGTSADQKVIYTYELNTPAAYVLDGETILAYYETFAQAAAKAVDAVNTTKALKTVVLLKNIDTDYTLPYGKQINVQLDGYTLNVLGGQNKTDPEKHYAVLKTEEDGVTNFKSVEAVASIDFTNVSKKNDDIRYYATFAEAAELAYVTGDAKAKLQVTILKTPVQPDPDDPEVIPDLFAVSETGSLWVATSTDLKKNFDMAPGLAYTRETGTGNDYTIKIVAAEAYLIKNDGTYEYFDKVKDACDEASNTTKYGKNGPVVYLLKEELSYGLAKNAVLHVDKNGFDDFEVTTSNPTDGANNRYAILEDVNGTVSTYTTSDDVIAYINFAYTKVNEDTDYQVVSYNKYVFYQTLADAAYAAQGEMPIFLTRNMVKTADKDDTYYMSAGETLIVDKTSTGYATRIFAPEGYALAEAKNNKERDSEITYTVELSVATVEAKFIKDDENKYTHSFANFADAVAEADAYYDHAAVMTLWAPVPDDVRIELGTKSALKVVKNDTFKFAQKNFVAPDGYFATFTENDNIIEIKVKEAKAAIGEGDDIVYFDSLTAAINAAVEIERGLGHYGDVHNPTSVITLFADNESAYMLTDNGVQSLLIKANGYKPNLTVYNPDLQFIEKIETDTEGVLLYKKALIVASVEIGPLNDRETVYFSSFSAAAEKVFNSADIVTLYYKSGNENFKADDVFEMVNGTLNVVFKNGGTKTDFDNLIDTHIVAKGDKLTIRYEIGSDYCTYTVSGAVAAITTPKGTTYYYDFSQALQAAIRTPTLIITPLTDITYYMTVADNNVGVKDGGYVIIDQTDYEMNLFGKNFEVIQNGVQYTVNKAVACVQTDEIASVDIDTNAATFYDRYFAEYDDAVAFAGSSKFITLLENVEYEFTDPSVVLYFYANDKRFDGYTTLPDHQVVLEDVKGVTPRAVVFYVSGLETITVDAGDGYWKVGDDKLSVLNGKLNTGATVNGVKNDSKNAWEQINIFATEPVLPGYHLAYLEGSDGNKNLYKFSGITADQRSAGLKVLPEKMPFGGLTLTAVWEPNEYWVFFNDGTTDLGYIRSTYGELIQVPAKYTEKDHYDFGGWFLKNTLSVVDAFDIANTKLVNTEDLPLIGPDLEHDAKEQTWQSGDSYLKLYGKFTPKVYTVSFITDSDMTVPDQRVKYNETVDFTQAMAIKRDGYTLLGYHYKDADGKLVGWTYTTPVNKDTVLYANWKAEQMTVYWADGDVVLYGPQTVDVGAEITPPVYDSENKQIAKREKAGYRLDTENMWADFDGTVQYNEKKTVIYQLNWIEQMQVTFLDNGKKIGQILVDKDSHLADAKDVPAPTKEGYTLVWQSEGEDYDVNAPIQSDLILMTSWVEGEDVSEYATVVSSLNAYVTNKENTVPGDYEVKVEFNGNTMMEGTLDTVGTYVASTNEYRLADIAVIAAPQMNDAATVTITYQGKEVLSKDLSVRAYAEEWIEKSEGDELAEMLKSLLDFGAYSQILFKYETDNLVNSKYSTGKVPTTTVPVYNITKDGSVTGITGVSPSLTLVSNTSLNMYFSVAKKNSKIAFSVDGKTASASYNAKEYRVEKAGINIVNLDKEIVYTATLGDETFTVSAAPLAYAYMHQNDGDGLGEVCKAVYQYYLAAVEYFS